MVSGVGVRVARVASFSEELDGVISRAVVDDVATGKKEKVVEELKREHETQRERVGAKRAEGRTKANLVDA